MLRLHDTCTRVGNASIFLEARSVYPCCAMWCLRKVPVRNLPQQLHQPLGHQPQAANTPYLVCCHASGCVGLLLQPGRHTPYLGFCNQDNKIPSGCICSPFYSSCKAWEGHQASESVRVHALNQASTRVSTLRRRGLRYASISHVIGQVRFLRKLHNQVAGAKNMCVCKCVLSGLDKSLAVLAGWLFVSSCQPKPRMVM